MFFLDKDHLFTWTDERVVEEVEDLKVLVTDLKEDLSELRAEMVVLAKQLEPSNNLLEPSANGSSSWGCVIL